MTSSFLWGAATSSHQVEGNNRLNDWWQWEQSGHVPESSGRACEQYERYEDDFCLASGLGHTAHRFSLEWSRLEPSPGRFDPEAFAHYRRVLESLHRHGMVPVVTLHHFTLPLWFSEKGGWECEDAPECFARYVRRAAAELGEFVSIWITLNEPLVQIFHGYIRGVWPPGKQSLSAGLTALRHMLQAHVKAYSILHRTLCHPVQISIAKHMIAYSPCREGNLPDVFTAGWRSWLFNRLVIESLLSGFLFVPGIFCEFLERERTLDFIGLNYYTRHFVRFPGISAAESVGAVCDFKHHSAAGRETSDLGWEVNPEGFHSVLTLCGRFRLPVIICENGIATSDDARRERFLRSHLEEMERARREGVDIRGYFHWSLVDNFEWAEGFAPRFGLIGVDYATQARKIRASAHVLSSLCRK